MQPPLKTSTVVRVVALLLAPFAILGAFYAYQAHAKSPPSHAMCVAQADHRIALHNAAELPSIAKWIASTRQSMIDTCRRYWTRAYVSCLIDAPTLQAVQDCERVGRVR